MTKLDALTREIIGNRRIRRRKRFVYDVILRDEGGERIFRGKTVNLSCSGARLTGFPCSTGPEEGQAVQVEFLVVPKNLTQVSRVAIMPAQIWRIDDKEGAFTLAIKFDRELPE
jgi:hypothetical protein